MEKTSNKATAAEAPLEPIGRSDKQKMLAPARLADPDFGWRTWQATIPPDVPLEHILSGRFWRLALRRIKRGDHIAFRNDFLTRFGELVVVGIDHQTGDAEVKLLWCEDVEAAALANSDSTGYEVRDAGVHKGYEVVRMADGHVMKSNLRSYAEAMRTIRIEYVPLRPDIAGEMLQANRQDTRGTIGR